MLKSKTSYSNLWVQVLAFSAVRTKAHAYHIHAYIHIHPHTFNKHHSKNSTRPDPMIRHKASSFFIFDFFYWFGLVRFGCMSVVRRSNSSSYNNRKRQRRTQNNCKQFSQLKRVKSMETFEHAATVPCVVCGVYVGA